MPLQIDMEVVLVMAVSARPQHGLERATGTGPDIRQELALLASSKPTLLHADMVAAFKAEA